jgi:type 1 glutamine amidotransferase
MKKALVVWGGWKGHEPDQVARILGTTLEKEGFAVETSDTLDSLNDLEKLKPLHLIVPIWTMGKISKEQVGAVTEAVADGTGIAGCHGGMCDAFRESVEWQFMTGGNWVSHPGGGQVEYEVNIRNSSSPIVQGIADFRVTSEQYYLHVDPAIEVLATTRFPTIRWYHSSNRPVDVPAVWTKRWGVGRVFYTSLGHVASVFDVPEVMEIMRRGMLWAAEGKDVAIAEGLSSGMYKSQKQMF